MSDSTRASAQPPGSLPRTRRRRVSTARRYLISVVIGFVLVFLSETALRSWTHEGTDKTQEPVRVQELSRINQRLIDAPRAVRPWDVAASVLQILGMPVPGYFDGVPKIA